MNTHSNKERSEYEIEKLYELFREFYDAYAQERSRLDQCERMYHGDHWCNIPDGEHGEPRPITPIIHSTIENIRGPAGFPARSYHHLPH